MEGLVSEAIKHTIEEAPERGPVRDAAIIGQYQCLTHYGITAFRHYRVWNCGGFRHGIKADRRPPRADRCRRRYVQQR